MTTNPQAKYELKIVKGRCIGSIKYYGVTSVPSFSDWSWACSCGNAWVGERGWQTGIGSRELAVDGWERHRERRVDGLHGLLETLGQRNYQAAIEC